MDRDPNITDDQIAKLEYSLGYVPDMISTFPPGLLNEFLTPEAHSYLGPRRDSIQHILSHFDAQQLENIRNKWEVVNSSLYLESKTVLPAILLTVLGDRNEMAHSIEGRLPFLDHHLVEYVNHLPQRVKIKGTREKWILREAAKSFIHDSVYNRMKHPFWAPPAFLDPTTRLHELVQSTLRSSEMKDLWFIDQKKVIASMDALTAVSRDYVKGGGSSDPATQARFVAALFGGDAKFLSIVSYVMLKRLFNVK